MTWQIIVPTRNSAAWVGAFARAYDALGVRPLYLYDSRSADDTLAILRAAAMDVVEISPTLDRVEGMLAAAWEVTAADWVVRFDDDELPSRALLDWLAASLSQVAAPTVAFSRRDALFAGGALGYSRLEDYYFHPTDPTFLDPQWRVPAARGGVRDGPAHRRLRHQPLRYGAEPGVFRAFRLDHPPLRAARGQDRGV